MSEKQVQGLRDAVLAERVRRAMGGIPGLKLMLATDVVAEVRRARRIVGLSEGDLTAREKRVLAECRRVNGGD